MSSVCLTRGTSPSASCSLGARALPVLVPVNIRLIPLNNSPLKAVDSLKRQKKRRGKEGEKKGRRKRREGEKTSKYTTVYY
jgi:hypothetical protein